MKKKQLIKKAYKNKKKDKKNYMWKEIEELSGYLINGLGQFKNFKTGLVYKYRLNIYGYYITKFWLNGKRKSIQQHQIVMRYYNDDYRLFQGMRYVVDHLNSVKTDNRIENLRVVSQRENSSKERTIKSGLPVGVCYDRRSRKYKSSILIGKKRIHLGLFNTPEEASNTYQKKLLELTN